MEAREAIEGKTYNIPGMNLTKAELSGKDTYAVYFLTFDTYGKRKIRMVVLNEPIEESK